MRWYLDAFNHMPDYNCVIRKILSINYIVGSPLLIHGLSDFDTGKGRNRCLAAAFPDCMRGKYLAIRRGIFRVWHGWSKCGYSLLRDLIGLTTTALMVSRPMTANAMKRMTASVRKNVHTDMLVR